MSQRLPRNVSHNGNSTYTCGIHESGKVRDFAKVGPSSSPLLKSWNRKFTEAMTNGQKKAS